MFHWFKTARGRSPTIEALLRSEERMPLRSLALVLALLVPLCAGAASTSFRPPASGPIPVAVVVTEGANVIDLAGPWEVFQDSARPGSHEPAFRLYTVGDSRRAVRLTGGLTVVPDYTFDDAPAPSVIVVGAQRGSAAMQQWLKRVAVASQTDALMSVCTGAFKLADAGILDGKHATTHHDFFDEFARRFPRVTLERGARFVESSPHVFTAGGLTSGIDLALHVVALYYGENTARDVARYMEYRRAQE
jgi:transcriptional regulator GlxA family with amidase domain